MPMSMLLRFFSALAFSLSSKPSALAMARILFLVPSLMPGCPFSTLETVLPATPAFLAISYIVTYSENSLMLSMAYALTGLESRPMIGSGE